MFSKPNAIVYVRRNGLIVAGKRLTPARHTFAESVVRNMEVLDHEKFIDSMATFFQQQGIKAKHVLMVLDDSLVFAKELKLEPSDDPAAAADDFISAMPFEPGQRACLRVVQGRNLFLFATNGELYNDLARALHEAGAGRLLAITPAAAYPRQESKQLAAAIQQYINDTETRANANFLHTALV